jgi:aryl-alcohol dehydrogenase-like predicted oxidoreductase
MKSMHDAVKAGKARYIGASNMAAWQFARALYVAELHGWTRLATMQDHLNLLYRAKRNVKCCRSVGLKASALSLGVPWRADG